MGKNKLARFAENKTFDHVFEPAFDEVFRQDYTMKGKWNKVFFKNDHPLVIELACGRGEYTVGLAERFPDKNFIGMDLKGARIWRGAKNAHDKGLKNVAFIRFRIEMLSSFFAENEIAEIWLTFPDPQKKKPRKRLTSARYLNVYKDILEKTGIVHLKTDSATMYNHTVDTLAYNDVKPEVATNNLYKSDFVSEVLSIKTYYEMQFLERDKTIKYCNFHLPKDKEFMDLPKKEK